MAGEPRGAERAVLGHRGELYTAALSPDRRTLAAAGVGPAVHLLSRAAGAGRDLAGGGARVDRVAFSPGGAHLASAGQDGVVRLWPLPTAEGAAEPAVFTGHDAEVRDLAFSPDGATLASAGLDRVVRLWAIGGEARSARVLRGHGAGVSTLAFSPSGELLASASEDGAIFLWNVGSGEGYRLGRHAGEVFALAFSPDSRILLSSGRDGAIRLWQLSSGVSYEVPCPSPQARLAVSPSGRLLAGAGLDGDITVWDLETGGRSIALRRGGRALSLSFSGDGLRLTAVLVEGGLGEEYSLRVWSSDLFPEAPGGLAAWLSRATNATIDPP
jgi:WD40 repeat protein